MTIITIIVTVEQLCLNNLRSTFVVFQTLNAKGQIISNVFFTISLQTVNGVVEIFLAK